MASKKAVVAARAALIAVYKGAAEEALPKEQLNLLHKSLRRFSDQEVGMGIEKMVLGQENVWKDGMSVYAVLSRFCSEAQAESRRAQSEDERRRRSNAWKQWIDGHSPEEAAIGRYRVRLLARGRNAEALAFGELSREEQLKMLPAGAVESAEKHILKLRAEGPPTYFQLPESTDE